MSVQPAAKFRDAVPANRNSRGVRVAAELFKEIGTLSETIEQVIRFDAASRAMSDLRLQAK